MTGAELRKCRISLGMSQREFARAIRYCHSTVSRWESGTMEIRRPWYVAATIAELEAARKEQSKCATS